MTISWLLRSSHATLNETAAMLAMGPRTLQRKLKGNGTDFATLLAAVRAEIAVAYLSRDESQPIGQLAILLGYSEPSAVSRFLRETFGHDGRVLRQRRPRPPVTIGPICYRDHPHPRRPGGRVRRIKLPGRLCQQEETRRTARRFARVPMYSG